MMLTAAALAPGTVAAQRSIGGILGMTSAKLAWDGGQSSDTRSGLLIGAYLDQQTPVPWLNVIAEGAYAQGGGRLDLSRLEVPDGVDFGVDSADARSDHLSFALLASGRIDWGPVSLALLAGPGVAQYVGLKAPASLGWFFGDETPQIFFLAGGASLEARLGPVWNARIEARFRRDVSPTFEGQLGEIRGRSLDIAVRLGQSR